MNVIMNMPNGLHSISISTAHCAVIESQPKHAAKLIAKKMTRHGSTTLKYTDRLRRETSADNKSRPRKAAWIAPQSASTSSPRVIAADTVAAATIFHAWKMIFDAWKMSVDAPLNTFHARSAPDDAPARIFSRLKTRFDAPNTFSDAPARVFHAWKMIFDAWKTLADAP